MRSGAKVGGFFSGVVFFARMSLARSVFHGFQIRLKRLFTHKNRLRYRRERASQTFLPNLNFCQKLKKNEINIQYLVGPCSTACWRSCASTFRFAVSGNPWCAHIRKYSDNHYTCRPFCGRRMLRSLRYLVHIRTRALLQQSSHGYGPFAATGKEQQTDRQRASRHLSLDSEAQEEEWTVLFQ